MKSRLFRRFDPKDIRENRFAEDIALLLSLTFEQWEAVVTGLPALMQAEIVAEQGRFMESIETKTGVPSSALSRICAQARFFLSAFHTEDIKDENPSLWAEDLVDAKLVEVEQQDKLVSFLSTLKDRALLQMEALQRHRSAEAGVFPAFSGAATTVELRGVFTQEYTWGEPVEDYAPELETTTPIVSVAIKVDSGMMQTFVFQATPKDLDCLISTFTAAKKCADTLQKTSAQT